VPSRTRCPDVLPAHAWHVRSVDRRTAAGSP
jgi:hypothetical protein